jgi:hypothetical protein
MDSKSFVSKVPVRSWCLRSRRAAAAQDYPNRRSNSARLPARRNVDIIARLWEARYRKRSASRSSSKPNPALPAARRGDGGAAIRQLHAPGRSQCTPAHGALSKSVKYNVVDDFEWISIASFYPFLVCVRKDSPFRTLGQLIDAARKDPGGLKYGSAGVGSILHTTVELIGNETKTKFLHVPYRGEAPAITALLQGDIDFIAATSGPISARIRSGEFRALAVTGKTRWRDFPDVPTVEEQGIPGFEVISWTGLAGPAKPPKPIALALGYDSYTVDGDTKSLVFSFESPPLARMDDETRGAAVAPRAVERIAPAVQTFLIGRVVDILSGPRFALYRRPLARRPRARGHANPGLGRDLLSAGAHCAVDRRRARLVDHLRHGRVLAGAADRRTGLAAGRAADRSLRRAPRHAGRLAPCRARSFPARLCRSPRGLSRSDAARRRHRGGAYIPPSPRSAAFSARRHGAITALTLAGGFARR